MSMYEEVQHSAAVIREKVGGDIPKIALVLGSGLNQIAEELENATRISYADLPGFPQPTVEGHAGTLHVGELDGNPLI